MLSHMYAVTSPLVIMVRPKLAPKSTPSHGPIPKPHYLPQPWSSSTYDAKRHPDPIGRYSTMHCDAYVSLCVDKSTHRLTYASTDRPRESLTTIGRYAMKAMRPNKQVIVVL